MFSKNITINLEKKDDTIHAEPLGDVHKGHIGYNKKAFIARCKAIAKESRRFTFFMGDQVDAINEMDKRWERDSVLIPELDDQTTGFMADAKCLLDSHRDFLDEYKGKILGLTGTPPKYDSSVKGKMVNEYCPIVYEFVTDSAVENNILNDYQIIVHELELSTKNNYLVEMKNKSFRTSEQKNYAYWCNRIDARQGSMQILRVMRMKAMMEYPSKEQYAGLLFNSIKDKCIMFANTQVQADRLCDYSYHSQNPDSERNLEMFKEGTIDKLSSVMQLNEGVNIPELRQGIIMHAYGNERKAQQRIGRLLRLNPDEKAIIHILCYVNTVDEKWVKSALETLDQSKIEWKNYNVNLG